MSVHQHGYIRLSKYCIQNQGCQTGSKFSQLGYFLKVLAAKKRAVAEYFRIPLDISEGP